MGKIILNQILQQGVAVDPADEVSGIVVGGDIGRILRQNISNQLIYGVIALFTKCLVNGEQYIPYLLLLIVSDGKGLGSV